MLKNIYRSILPVGIRRMIRLPVNVVREFRTNLHSARFKEKTCAQKPGSLVKCFNYDVRINDGANFHVLYNDIFIHGIYYFRSRRNDPVILDCGSNIGMSILYFKHIYPQARIIGFEPDPAIFPYLQENISRNGLTNVQLVQSALSGREGTLTFYSDGKYGSCLANHFPADIPDGWSKYEVPCVRLRDYLSNPVDFVKMNIEGPEWDVLADADDALRMVREMAIEYHHLPGLPRTLHKILELLHRKGFEYAVSDFNLATYSGARPPIQLNSNTRYYRQIYARRSD